MVGPWWAPDGSIVPPQGSRAVLMYLSQTRASVSEMRVAGPRPAELFFAFGSEERRIVEVGVVDRHLEAGAVAPRRSACAQRPSAPRGPLSPTLPSPLLCPGIAQLRRAEALLVASSSIIRTSGIPGDTPMSNARYCICPIVDSQSRPPNRRQYASTPTHPTKNVPTK